MYLMINSAYNKNIFKYNCILLNIDDLVLLIYKKYIISLFLFYSFPAIMHKQHHYRDVHLTLVTTRVRSLYGYRIIRAVQVLLDQSGQHTLYIHHRSDEALVV